jgi:predicted DNA-binding transcriptional regulator YafY
VDALAEQLTPVQREAAEYSAGQVLEQVRASLQGYLAFPAWQTPDAPKEVMPAIEAALAEQHDLILTYWGAGREQATVRRVTPYWLERRNNTLYLIAYCHLREDERVFRVDRMLDARPSPTSASPDSVV